jgi:hypothetical protein
MKKRTAFIIALSVAAGAGIDETVEALVGEAKAAVETDRVEMVCTDLGAAAQATIESFVQTAHCSTIDTVYELTGDEVCDVANDLDAVNLSWINVSNPSGVTMCSTFRLEGEFTARIPE